MLVAKLTEKEFIASLTNKILSEGLKSFPEDFREIKDFQEINLPSKSLLIGTELFGKVEIITPDGSFVLQAENYNQAKYIIYAGRNKSCRIKIPENTDEIKSLLSGYEKYLDSFVLLIDKEYKKNFQDRNSDFVVNEIFRALNLVRY